MRVEVRAKINAKINLFWGVFLCLVWSLVFVWCGLVLSFSLFFVVSCFSSFVCRDPLGFST